MAKLIITADWHLGYRQYGLDAREEDFYKAAWDVLRMAGKRKADAIILAGDILHVNRPSSRVMAEISKMHLWATEKKLPIFYILGNHDTAKPDWLLQVQELHPSNYGFQSLDTDQGTVAGVTVTGLSFLEPVELLTRLETLPPGGDILVLHQPIREFCGFPTESYPSVDQLPIGKYQVIVLGDIHINEVKVITKGDTWSWVGYPGSTEMNSESEPEHKCCWELIIEATHKQVPLKLEYLHINTREVFKFNLSNTADEEAMHKKVDSTKPERAMLYIKYPSTWVGFMQRLLAKYPAPKFILRFDPVEVANSTEAELAMAEYRLNSVGDNNQEAPGVPMHIRLPVEQVLESVVPAGSPVFKIAQSMMQRDSLAVGLVDAYIDQRVNELGIK